MNTGHVRRTATVAAVAAMALLPGEPVAAPDEEALGKSEGYPVCGSLLAPEPRCLVGLVSRRDEIHPHRIVARPARARALQRAASEPPIRIDYGQYAGTIDDYLARNRTTGLLILKDHTILVERYQYERTPMHRMTSFSMAKTVVAMLVGLALAEGSIRSLDDPAGSYVPELRGTPYGETAIRHLLTMSSGVRFSESDGSGDDVAVMARLSILGESEGGAATVMPFRVRERPPGRKFSYASGDSQVLALVLRAATGMPLADQLSEKVWKPMGAESDASWMIDRGGFEIGWAGLNATLRDYGRFGLLLAHDGALDGRRILPVGWVKAATTPPAPPFEPGRSGAGLFGYGYQTWLIGGGERQFALIGRRDQAIFVDPRSKLVLVHTAAGAGGGMSGDLLALWFSVARTLAKMP
jgi:CubicO group peptidase (beta-lactamase class C family)